jgi:myosin heavy subunit
LLGIAEALVQDMLVFTVSMVRGENLKKNFDVDAAEANRDALAKAIYGRLFGWIVHRANSLLRPTGQAYERAKSVDGGLTEVGILGIGSR